VVASNIYGTKEVRLWRLSDGEKLPALTGQTQDGITVAFNPVNKQIVAAGSDDGIVRLWRIGEPLPFKVLTEDSDKGYVFALEFSADGKRLISASVLQGSVNKIIRLWHVDEGKYESYTSTDMIMAINADHGLVVTTDDSKNSKTLKFTQVSSGNSQELGGVLSYEITSPGAFSHDVQMLATGVANGNQRGVLIWRVSNGSQLHSYLIQSESNVSNVAFSPDGKLIAAGWENGQVEVWRVDDEKHLASLKKHDGAIRGLSFSENGRILASSSVDNKIQLWEVADNL
jgi:WD40 repeat protein